MRKLNHWFVCKGCWVVVLPASKTTRNHCPECFFSLHVDGDVPWDRDTSCWGDMLPINFLIKHGKQKIEFQCVKCNKTHTNKVAGDDELGSLLDYIHRYRKEFLDKDNTYWLK